MLELARNGLIRVAVSRNFQRTQRRPTPEVIALEPGVFESVEERDAQLAPLIKTIESEIIPRLMFAHRGVDSPPVPTTIYLEKPSQAEVFALTQLLLTQEMVQSLDFVDAMRLKGMMPESLYLELLAPAARSLGEQWDADTCDFVQVTIALGRLHQVLRIISQDSQCEDRDATCAQDRKVLLASVPGEQHTFGLAIVAEFFQRAGWDVRSGHQKTSPDLTSIVRSERFDVAGFSVGSDCRLDGLARWICAVRSASINDKIVILVGGPIFIEHPEYAPQVGADASTSDAQQAVVAAETLVALRRS